MQKLGDTVVYSASDLMAFSGCRHRTALDRLHLETRMEKAGDDDYALLLQKMGLEHERAYLENLREQGLQISEIADGADISEQVRLTREALHSGADIVYQPVFLSGQWLGKADFLFRVDIPSDLGSYSYEVADTKLAKKPKPYFLVQLCLYSELLARLQGRMAEKCKVILGDQSIASFKVASFIHYYKRLKLQFEGLASDPAGTNPEPCAACDLCHWRERCGQEWRDADHLSQVANVSRGQRKQLIERGIDTVAALATAKASDRPRNIGAPIFERLRGQAALQVGARESGQHVAKCLPLDPDRIRGFYRLPKPADGDIAFDIEGYPHAENGLEYLLGVYFFDQGEPQYRAFWGHDTETEKLAFEELVDFLVDRLQAHPDAHIYHYANYEERALKKLMTLYGTRESVVDDWLREDRLVDLYQVVREGLLVSLPSYSLKDLETFYMKERAGGVQTAASSVIEYDKWLESNDPEILESIRAYNEDDCRSTLLLRDWLLDYRPDDVSWFHDDDDGNMEAGDKPDEIDEAKASRIELVQAVETCNVSEELRTLAVQLLDFHQREQKPGWWSVFNWADSLAEALVDDTECIGVLTEDEDGNGDGVALSFRFPPQDSKLAEGASVCLASDTKSAGRIQALDLDRGILELIPTKRRREEGLPTVFSLTPGGPINDMVLRGAVERYVASLPAGGEKFRATTAILCRELPRISGVEPGAPIMDEGIDVIEGTTAAVQGLDESYLYVQGPPGSGKTHVGARVILNLIREGARVGVTANSHKAINNLLRAVEEHAEEEGVEFSGRKKVGRSEDTWLNGTQITDVQVNSDIDGTEDIVGATAWLFARAEFEQTFDYLFVDEAGQISLGNIVAVGRAAKNIVLLGDQMQLGQPSQAVHPGESGLSVLDYLLRDHATIPRERGIFLPKSWRMHEDVCRWVSDYIYEGRLNPHPDNANQGLILKDRPHPALKPTGISFHEVQHEGCTQRSQEEASDIQEIFDDLLRHGFVDRDMKRHEMTLDDILVVAPYNMQVNLLKGTLPDGARVGTVDKFQGQQAEVVILSMCSSSAEDVSRGLQFLFNKNRLNVAISRARCLAIVVASPRLLEAPCTSVDLMELANLFCSIRDYSQQ